MSTVAMSGSDTIIINNRVLADLGDGDVVMLDYTSDIANAKTGKNGNTVYALNETGKQAEVKIRIIRASADDKFLNSLLAQQSANFAGFPLMIGRFVKRIGDGAGNVASDTYVMSGGIFKKALPAKSNVEGDVDQSIVIYEFKFSNAPRVIS